MALMRLRIDLFEEPGDAGLVDGGLENLIEEPGRTMPKKPSRNRPRKSSKPARLPPLTAVQQQVITHVMNSIAFGKYDKCCSIEEMAGYFKKSPGRFRPTLRKLVDKGYLTIRGEALPWVYPTVAAIRQQDRQLSEADAKKILAKIGK